MGTSKILKYGLLHALAGAAYVAAVATLMFNLPKHQGPPDTVLMPIAFLSLFVLSAAIMGLLFFARPLMWYLQGEKTAAVKLMAYIVGTFAAVTILVLGILIFIYT